MYGQIQLSEAMSTDSFYIGTTPQQPDVYQPTTSLPSSTSTSNSTKSSLPWNSCCALCTEHHHLSTNLQSDNMQLDDKVVDSIISKCFGSVDQSITPAHLSLRCEELALDVAHEDHRQRTACGITGFDPSLDGVYQLGHGQETFSKMGLPSHDFKFKEEAHQHYYNEASTKIGHAFSTISTTPQSISTFQFTNNFHPQNEANTITTETTFNSDSLPHSDHEIDYTFTNSHHADAISNQQTFTNKSNSFNKSQLHQNVDASDAKEPSHNGVTKKKSKRVQRARARPWTAEEQNRFEESLELYGRNWEQCAMYIGTRRTSLVRSHAQKHLIKLWKLGKPLPKKVAETGSGYTLSGKPLLPESASAKSYLLKLPCPAVE